MIFPHFSGTRKMFSVGTFAYTNLRKKQQINEKQHVKMHRIINITYSNIFYCSLHKIALFSFHGTQLHIINIGLLPTIRINCLNMNLINLIRKDQLGLSYFSQLERKKMSFSCFGFW